MMDDALFLRVLRIQFRNNKRLGSMATLSADNALRLLEMAERWHAEHDHDNDRVITEMVTSWEDVA